MSNGNPFYIDPRMDVYNQGLSKISQALEGRRTRAEEEKAKQKAEARYESFIKDYDAAMASGEARDINRLGVLYPEYAAASKGALGILEDESDENKIGREKEFGKRLFDYLGEENPLKQREMILGNIENLESQGRDATHQKRLLQQHDQDPTKGKELAEWEFGKIVGDKEFKRYQGIRGGEAVDIGGGEVKSSEILDDGTVIEVLKNGSTKVIDSQGNELTGRARTEAIIAASKFGTKMQRERAAGRTEGTRAEIRADDMINRGQEAAQSTAGLRRGLELLTIVETGGIDKIQAELSNTFGIQSADVGELSNLLGLAVLSQLKATFGAAFSENEGARLEKLSASIGKSPAANKRILENALKIAVKSAKRARKAALDRGQQDVVDDIDDLLTFTLGPAVEAQKQAPAQTPSDAQNRNITVDW